MIGKIIGAALGAQAAKKSKNVGGASGAAIGAAVPFVLRRISIPTILAMGAGGFIAKKLFDKKSAEDKAQKLSGTDLKTPGSAPDAETGSVIDPPPGGATNGSGKRATPAVQPA